MEAHKRFHHGKAVVYGNDYKIITKLQNYYKIIKSPNQFPAKE